MYSKRLIPAFILIIVMLTCVSATKFETAKTAVSNMKIGWNLGNTLDSNSGDTTNMWLEWSAVTPTKYETAWGQPVTTRQLIHMFKEAGFNAIRVPVTWYPHKGIECKTVAVKNSEGKTEYKRYWYMSQWKPSAVDDAWMARIREVVDYVIDEGMYCILNVHHDTGTANSAWIKASMDNYRRNRDTFEQLWTEIANEFRDYDEHLLFEGYNEVTDKYDSWCYATFGASSRYVADDADDAYNAINSYAQSFVNAVRATGGNNAERNIIVNTYAGCSGSGSWSTHLLDPVRQMALPDDITTDHLIFEVHDYPNISNLSSAKSQATTMMSNLVSLLGNKGALIIGEWGTSDNSTNYNSNRSNFADFAKYYVQQATLRGIATFYWMGLSNGDDRTSLQWSQPEIKDAIVKGYYGDGGYINGISEVHYDTSDVTEVPHSHTPTYNVLGQHVGADSKGIVISNGQKILRR